MELVTQLQQLAIDELQSSSLNVESPAMQEIEGYSLNQLKQELTSNKYSELTAIRQQVKNQFHVQQDLVKLLNIVGYTGFIHHFKNYVLRHQPIDYQLAKEEHANLNKLVNHLLNTLSLNEQQKKTFRLLI